MSALAFQGMQVQVAGRPIIVISEETAAFGMSWT